MHIPLSCFYSAAYLHIHLIIEFKSVWQAQFECSVTVFDV